MKRTRYQFGCLQLKERTKQPTVWVLRYRLTQPDGGRRHCSIQVGTLQQYPTESSAWKAAEALRLVVNSGQHKAASVTFETLVDRYILEALPERFSTRVSYQSMLKTHLRPRWSGHSLTEMAENPFIIEQWLKSLALAQRTKAHVKSLLHRLFEYAMKWKLLSVQRNPIELVEVKGGTRRRKRPRILTVEEFHKLLPLIPEPYRTMVLAAQCLGLRVSEILALKWEDVDLQALTIMARRSVVHGRVDTVKTEYSEDVLPLDPGFATILSNWSRQCPRSTGNWLFPNPSSLKPYHASPIQQDYIRAAGRRLGLGDIGWHTFRHTYRSWLDATGAPLGVQQKLMRHAQISTTMNVYGDALLESKREANSKVVGMLKPVLVAARQ